MLVVPPIDITPAMLTTSPVAEPAAAETAWVSGGTYTLGDLRIRTTTHRVYEAVQASTGRTAFPEVDAAYWLDVGPTLRWAMFDTLRSTQTEAASPAVFVITPGQRFDSLALLGVIADSATVSISVGGSVIFSRTQAMFKRRVLTWYQYLITPFRSLQNWAMHDIPPVTGAVITVTLTRASGNVKIGDLLIGRKEFAGVVLQDPEDDALNFSKIERAFDGTASLIPRRSVPKTTQTLFVEKSLVPRLREVRESLNATPALWSGMDENTDDDYYDALLIKGIYKRFTFTLKNTQHATVSLELEEI